MTAAEQWRRVQALVEQIETLPESEQLARLHALEPDEHLRREALALVEAMREETDFQRRHRARSTTSDPLPDIVGGVRILERIGAGGSGEVFRGVRTVNGTEQIVAVKRFHAHRVSSEHLQRFAREQRMLAVLTHRDIVRLFDAGVTDDGRPYIVMELAVGQPITGYCDARRLDVAARLRLFRSVCAAVQAAHHHLIVHLDLKPSNILVTDEGRVKLLDFGTAKQIDAQAALTRTEPLTLSYASPEQLRGEPVSVACDVYSLALILFELVAGAWPFRQRDSLVSVAERAAGRLDPLTLSRAIASDAPELRGTSMARLRAIARGDLDAIVSKALAHDPAARYASVDELAEDLRRFAAGEPVRARTPGVGYLVGRFVRRHLWEVAGAATLVVALAGAALYSTGQARAARIAAARAETQNRFLASVFSLAGYDASSRHDMTVRELLALADQRIAPALGDDATVAADIELTLAEGFVSQNAYADARGVLERMLRRVAASHDIVREAAGRAALSYVSYVENRTDDAIAEARAALGLWRAHQEQFPPQYAAFALRRAVSTLAFVNPTDAAYRDEVSACVDLTRRFPSAIATVDRASCLYLLAVLHANVDSHYDAADALLREALALHRADGATSMTASTLQMLGLVNRYRGQFAEDERAQREAYEIVARLQGPDSVAALWQRAVWVASLPAIGRAEEAYHAAQTLLAAARVIYPTRGAYLMWTPLFSASLAACTTERFGECETLAEEAIETLGKAPAEDDPRLHAARGFLGLALAHRGEHARARPLLEGALASNAARRRTPPYTAALQAALQRSSGAVP